MTCCTHTQSRFHQAIYQPRSHYDWSDDNQKPLRTNAGTQRLQLLNENAILLVRGQTLTEEPRSATIDRWRHDLCIGPILATQRAGNANSEIAVLMRRLTSWLLLATALLCNGPALAADQSDFLPGGRLTIIVGFSAGGGFDLYARLLARHIGRHLPGTPAVVVSNQPGAGSVKAAENILNIAPRDGTVIGLFGRTVPFAPLMSDRKFDGTRFEWIGSITEEVSTCVASARSRVQSWKDMLAREFVVGGEGRDSDLDINANLLKNIFGAKIKLVSGYPGSSDVKLAIQRGEVDGICGLSYSTFKNNYATERREKSVNVLLQVSLKRHPELGEVPFVGDFAKADEMSALRLLLEPQAMARPFAAPPGIAKDRLRTLQAAFDRTMKDAAFLEDAQNLHLDVAPMGGEDIKALVSSLYSLPQEARDKARIATGG